MAPPFFSVLYLSGFVVRGLQSKVFDTFYTSLKWFRSHCRAQWDGNSCFRRMLGCFPFHPQFPEPPAGGGRGLILRVEKRVPAGVRSVSMYRCVCARSREYSGHLKGHVSVHHQCGSNERRKLTSPFLSNPVASLNPDGVQILWSETFLFLWGGGGGGKRS